VIERPDARHAYSELRIQAAGEVEGIILLVVCT
jgi:uncharacterized DUF497 family protein